MIGELMAALKAIPEIARALREINTGIRHEAASRRKEEKDLALNALLAAARAKRGLRDKEDERPTGDDIEQPDGMG